MPAFSLLTARISAAADSGTRLEVGAVVLVLLVFVALLLVRAKQNRDKKIRKAASEGYYDPDVARYVRGTDSGASTETETDEDDRPLAPSFVAPVRSKASKRGAPVATPPHSVSTAFAGGDAVPPRPVPAFDPVAAVAGRPPTGPAPPDAPTAPVVPLPPVPAAPLPPPPPPPPPGSKTGMPSPFPHVEPFPPSGGPGVGQSDAPRR